MEINNEAKLKAKELIEWFMFKALKNGIYGVELMPLGYAKQCAIKVCDEFISNGTPKQVRFYKQVKKEIENYEQ